MRRWLVTIVETLIAGRGARRAPYDSICNMEGMTLRRLAEQMPGGEAEEMAEASHAGVGSLKELCARCCCQPLIL